jgi:hypothetical protein
MRFGPKTRPCRRSKWLAQSNSEKPIKSIVTVRESTAPQRMESVIPEDVRRVNGAMSSQVSPTPPHRSRPKRRRKQPEADLTPPEQPNIIEQLRKGDVTRKVTDTSGAEIKLSWVPEPNKLKPHGNLGETLDAMQTHPSAIHR